MATVTATPTITSAMLRSLGACPRQREIFKTEWPNGAEVTLENVLRALELGLDLDWGRRLFSPTARAEYERQRAPFVAEYERQVNAAWAEYQRQEATLWAEYQQQLATTWAEYERQVAPLWKEWQRQEATLWAEYQRQRATIWAAAFLASQTD